MEDVMEVVVVVDDGEERCWVTVSDNVQGLEVDR